MSIKKYTLYVVHHSHTDIGYTDLQERIIYTHIHYIKDAIKIIKDGYNQDSIDKDFIWNCETYFCVERFFEESSKEEKQSFFDLIKRGNIGLSANYLNFTDLVDTYILNKRIAEMCDIFSQQGIAVNTAMTADINGISLGNWDAFIDNGIEFLYTNIHCHHGMYPLYQNQTAYFWERPQDGKRILVWNGEHYNLGNILNLVHTPHANYMTEHYLGDKHKADPIDLLEKNVISYIAQCEASDYPYDFIPVSVSGVFSDNAPPNTEIIKNITEFNTRKNNITLQMVTLSELYKNIKDKLKNAPVYNGDLTDWWVHGVASTPYAVKHYKEAQRMYHVCRLLDADTDKSVADTLREAEDNLLLFAEHTWGHSATISNPYENMVLNLDIRNISYASKAHESCTKVLNRLLHKRGDKLRYYDKSGRVKAIHLSDTERNCVVRFYIEVYQYGDIEVIDESTGECMCTQIATNPRGIDVYFVCNFAAHEEKIFSYKELASSQEVINTRHAYIGSERVKDIINTFDTSYTLAHALENDFFRIEYKVGKGVFSFYNKMENSEMLILGEKCFFTPIYERTRILKENNPYEERRLLGRNIRGQHAQQYIGQLCKIQVHEHGAVFDQVELVYDLEGTYYSSVFITLYHYEARIDFKYRIAKHISEDIESIYLPFCLDLQDTTLYIDKGDRSFRPGIDQIPGTCMEYYLMDNGLIYKGHTHSTIIHSPDTPMIYMGDLEHHPICLCDNKQENNRRLVYSWLMNNLWETNFKMDLSGFADFSYSLYVIPTGEIGEMFAFMKDRSYGVQTCMVV